MKRHLALLALAGTGCLELVDGDHDREIVCLTAEMGAAPACSVAASEATAALDGAFSAFGAAEPFGESAQGLIERIDDDGLVIELGTSDIRFGWIDALPDGLRVGTKVTLKQAGSWELVLAENAAIAVLRERGDEPLPAHANELPRGDIAFSFTGGCLFERDGMRAIDLWVGAPDGGQSLAPGQQLQVGDWNVHHRAGWLQHLPIPEGDADGCTLRPQPGRYAVVTTATWSAGEQPVEGTCTAADAELAAALLRETRFGLSFSGTTEVESGVGTIESLEGDTVVVALEPGGTARFRWTAALPEELGVGERVEVRRANGWDELHGDIALAVREEMDFVGRGAIEPALGLIHLQLVPACTFMEPDPMCGGPAAPVQTYDLALPDGTILAAGTEGTSGIATIRHDGAVQYPSQGTESCIVEALFYGRTSVSAPPLR